jgi:SAM-dependent methyltransferase
MPVYQQIGQNYDVTRRADPYLVSRLGDLLQALPDAVYLDVPCGTGNYTLALAERGGIWHGVDHSQVMIDAARQKSDAVEWQIADVESLPYSDKTFSGAVCTLAIHHFEQLAIVFKGIYRVLSTGRLVLFTATPEQMQQYWLVEYFPEVLHRSAQQMPSLEKVERALKDAGFEVLTTEPYDVQEDLQDLFLYSGKHHPEFYLDASVRAGISTFALLADPDEVEKGCRRLAADIESGAIASVLQRFQHKQGDYLFVIAHKL